MFSRTFYYNVIFTGITFNLYVFLYRGISMSLISGLVKSLSKLSMIGRALMLPISLLPAAGLLLAFGDKFHLPLMMNAGGVIFDNLPMLFAIGSAVGLASESGIAALSAAVSVFVTNITISTVLGITPEMASQGGKHAMVVGIPTLQMGVFGGLICGILAAWCYNRFHAMQLPEFLGFFSGKRFVAIATAMLSFIMVCCCLISGSIFRRVSMHFLSWSTGITRRLQPLFSAWWNVRSSRSVYIISGIRRSGTLSVTTPPRRARLSTVIRLSGSKCWKKA